MFKTNWVCPTCYMVNTKEMHVAGKCAVERVKCDDCATISEIVVELHPVVTQVKLKYTPIEEATSAQ